MGYFIFTDPAADRCSVGDETASWPDDAGSQALGDWSGVPARAASPPQAAMRWQWLIAADDCRPLGRSRRV